jgi:hypothetical protein
MIDLAEYAQLSITAGVARRAATKARKTSKWVAAVKRHRTLKALLAKELRQRLSTADFAAAIGKDEPVAALAKRAHQLLNYDPSVSLVRDFPTREALIYAVYELHAGERKAAGKLEAWYKAILYP